LREKEKEKEEEKNHFSKKKVLKSQLPLSFSSKKKRKKEKVSFQDMAPRRIGIAVDGSYHARYAVQWYIQYMSKPDDEVLLINCIEPFTVLGVGSEAETDETKARMEKYLKDESEAVLKEQANVLAAKKVFYFYFYFYLFFFPFFLFFFFFFFLFFSGGQREFLGIPWKFLETPWRIP